MKKLQRQHTSRINFLGKPTRVQVPFVHSTLVWGPSVWVMTGVQADICPDRTNVWVDIFQGKKLSGVLYFVGDNLTMSWWLSSRLTIRSTIAPHPNSSPGPMIPGKLPTRTVGPRLMSEDRFSHSHKLDSKKCLFLPSLV